MTNETSNLENICISFIFNASDVLIHLVLEIYSCFYFFMVKYFFLHF